jgi:hypothetical protein
MWKCSTLANMTKQFKFNKIKTYKNDPRNRRAHTMCTLNGMLYLFGGYIDLNGSSNELWQYNIGMLQIKNNNILQLLTESEQYRQIVTEQQQQPRHAHSMVTFNNKLWVYGGLNNLTDLGDLVMFNTGIRSVFRI